MRGKARKGEGKGKWREGDEAQPLLSSSPSSSSIPRFSATSIAAMEDATDVFYGGKDPVLSEVADKVENTQSHTLQEYERLFGVDEDAFEQPTTTRKELWSYYLYYNGSIFTFMELGSIG